MIGLLVACAPEPDLRVGGVSIVDGKIAAIDAGAQPLVTAGFVDAHGHALGLGLGLTRLDLNGVDTYGETLAKVAAALPGPGWLLGRGWDHNRWSDAPVGGWPTAADLDVRWPDRPVLLTRVDGHAAWANSAALRAANITAETPDPPGGRIVRGADGMPTGVLIDYAIELVPVPKPSAAEIEAALVAAQNAMLASGLTGVHDMGVDDDTLAAWRRMDADGRLVVHVAAFLDLESQGAAELLASGPIYGRRLDVVGVKAYADGSLGSRGALLSAPYADDPTATGLRLNPADRVAELAIQCLKARAILAVHAIGDRAVTETLDAYAAARAAVPDASDVPLRIEHAQVVKPEDRARFAALNVIASMQPTHATSDMAWAETRLGPERIAWAYAWRSLADAGAHLAFGSDFPVESHEPARGVWAATRRQDARGEPAGGWRADQVVTLDEAVAAFTTEAWAAEGRPGLGALTVGAPATLTVWEGSADVVPGLHPVATYIDGAPKWRVPPTD